MGISTDPMFANRFTALLDANVLARVASRDLILSLAEAEFFRPRWTKDIMAETRRAIPKTLIKHDYTEDEAISRAERACTAMQAAFPEADVTHYEPLIESLSGMPDPDDAHVLAAAIQCKASVIVTDNLKDFPAKVLDSFEIEAKSADAFIADAVGLDPVRAIAAIARMRARLKKPALTAEELLLRLDGRGLKQTAAALSEFEQLL